jgi:predicted 3-demethylubiquinone-9 3-methyltransferase (glyoxalase superfamily)
MPKISPSLWFDNQAEEAANFYISVFPNSKLGKISRHTDAGPSPEGSVLTVDFELDGTGFNAINGGPHFTFSEAISFVIDCKDQAEVDYYWDHLLSGGGSQSQCGWLKDRFGVSWQVVPVALIELLSSPDKAKAKRVMDAMLQMVKLDVAKLEAAAAG